MAQSWWIASELVRRHPHLRIVETHPGGGQYDCLTLIDRSEGAVRAVVDLNRVGRMHVPGTDGAEPLDWAAALAANGGHDVVRALEAACGLPTPRTAPPSGPAVLCYRIIARVLTSLVDQRHAWDVRNGEIDSSGGSGRRPELDEFPSVVESMRHVRPDDLFGEPAYRFWLLMRDADAVAVLDVDGAVHFRDRSPSPLLPVYRASGRSLTSTVGQVLGHLLP
jgi:hypothetical protein